MSFWGVLSSTLFATLWFSWIALLIALIPAGIVAAVLQGRDSHWIIPADENSDERKVHYVVLSLAGGLMGEFAAVSSLSLGEWWMCCTVHQTCNDGQGGLVLIVTLPALSLFGSIIALLWTWVSLKIPAQLLYASVFKYSGPSPLLNWLCAIAIQLVVWSLFTIAIFRLTVM